MLIEFRVENHRSLRDEQVLSMEAARGGDPADPRPRKVPGYAKPLLPVAAIYGANASGKSNVLAAIDFMREAVLESYRLWRPDTATPQDPFAWGPTASGSTFEVDLVSGGLKLRYGFVVSKERFEEEWLHAWPGERKQVWFEREGDKYRFGDHFKGENSFIAGMTRPNALFVSTATQLKHPGTAHLYRWFHQIRTAVVRHDLLRRPLGPFTVIVPGADPPAEYRDRLLEFLRFADTGIVDIRVEPAQASWEEEDRYFFKHGSRHEGAWLPLDQESNGTRTLFNYASGIFHVLDVGALQLVDELEAGLHPELARKIVGLFNDPATNPRNAQLLFTTHDTGLIGNTVGEPALRRDQVWLTEKDAEGATKLYPLTDFRPRKAENLERGYLQGRYGAVPILGDFAAAGE